MARGTIVRMRRYALLPAFVVLASSASAAAAPKAITGKLTKSGYTVIALGADRAASVVVGSHGFSLRPPARAVTLHLRAPDGTYAGPIVVGGSAKLSVLGVKAGARLGTVRVRAGYAVLARRLAASSLDRRFTARARGGIPIGAGKLGLVSVKLPRTGAPGDRDRDGVPDAFDIDDDGDRILDSYDRKAPQARPLAREAQGSLGHPFANGGFFTVTTRLFGSASQAVNADAGSTEDQIAAAEQSLLMADIMWRGVDPDSAELDCGALIYCRAGGTGRFERGQWAHPDFNPNDPRASALAFPECCDTDKDGLGSFTVSASGGPTSDENARMQLYPGATADEIRAGDVLIERATINGAPMESASSMGYVFSTYPVVASYDDGQGDATTFSYPLPPESQCGPQSPLSCPQPARAGADGHVVLDLRFARPQRLRLAGDPGSGRWIDVGGLAYAVKAWQQREVPGPGTSQSGFCKADSYTKTDPALTPIAEVPLSGFGGDTAGSVLGDTAPDRPASSSNTFTNTLDVTRCLAALGLDINSTRRFMLTIEAWAISATDTAQTGSANSSVQFRLQ